MERAWRGFFLFPLFPLAIVPLLALSEGCATSRAVETAAVERVEPGLANAPLLPIERPLQSHDAIANGSDACSAPLESKPRSLRLPVCQEEQSARAVTLFAGPPLRPLRFDPLEVRWEIHRRGLPPCIGPRAPLPTDAALSLCGLERE
ncbi:MAG TPA: hypothetical protein VGI39_17540 [Polyangiaceae bacterium]|jgi:hypothetical protein